MIIKKTQSFIREYPSHTVFLSLLTIIIFGTCMLALPICRNKAINLIDLLFVTTSMITATGMNTISWYDFTTTGRIILLLLMQLGGLGVMVISLAIVTLFFDLGLYTKTITTEILSIKSLQDTRKIIYFIVQFTAVCELLGALSIFLIIRHDYPLQQAIFHAIFHSVSLFCNVGVFLFTNGELAYNQNIAMLSIATLLIICGGLGFVVWYEACNIIKKWYRNHKHNLSWHTVLVLQTYFISAFVVALLLWVLERYNTLQVFTPLQTFFNILLLSISTKSAGYISVPIPMMQPATILLLMIIAFIGSAPSSAGGGIKTSAFAIFIAVIRSVAMYRPNITIHQKHIAKDQIYKALAIITLSCAWIIVMMFCLLITEQHQPFMNVAYEAVSAFSNNGSTLGLTGKLSELGKTIIIISMIVGRIGALVLILGLRRHSDLENIPTEHRVILE